MIPEFSTENLLFVIVVLLVVNLMVMVFMMAGAYMMVQPLPSMIGKAEGLINTLSTIQPLIDDVQPLIDSLSGKQQYIDEFFERADYENLMDDYYYLAEQLRILVTRENQANAPTPYALNETMGGGWI